MAVRADIPPMRQISADQEQFRHRRGTIPPAGRSRGAPGIHLPKYGLPESCGADQPHQCLPILRPDPIRLAAVPLQVLPQDLLCWQINTGHQQPHKNRLIFSLLMNKSPLRRICEVADIGPEGLYGKIELLYRQSLAFAGHREAHMLAGMMLPRLYLAADNATGYVFEMHLNYDPTLDAEEVE